ncbi:hypothetical protein [Hyphomicrobium sp. DY-1]|uniref:hypothetical protein n=1 Tax=Hyphomicrobium sp. DY-1 TaxID=3075650 RepID=UPI0039C40536
MSGDRHAVLKKFSMLKVGSGSTRRVDFKGNRARLNLRIEPDVAFNLHIVKLATGENKNSFCERVLAEAIAEKVKELRSRYDDAAWQALADCAKKRKR